MLPVANAGSGSVKGALKGDAREGRAVSSQTGASLDAAVFWFYCAVGSDDQVMSRGSVWGFLKRLLSSPLLIPVVALPFAAVAITHFANTYPPDDVNLSADHIAGIQVSTAASATVTAVADHVRFAGATGQLEIVVPAPASACQQLASSLKTTCSGAGLTVMAPFSADATASQEFVLTPMAADQVRVQIQPAEVGGGVNVSVVGGGVAHLCVRQRVGAAGLTLHVGTTITALPAVTTQLADCEGIDVIVQSANPHGPSAFTFEGMRSARAVLTGRQMTVDAESLTLTLHSTAKDETFSRPVEVDSDRQVSVTALWAAPYFAAGGGVKAHATSVLEANAERLENELTRNAWSSLIVSGVTALVGLAVGAAIWFVARRTGGQGSDPPGIRAP